MRLFHRIAFAIGAVALFVAAEPRPAQADCPVPIDASPALAQINPNDRLQFLTGSLERAHRRASTWMWSWRVAYLGLAGGAVGLAQVTDDHNQRIDFYFGAGKSAAAELNQLAMPLHVEPATASAGPDICAALADSEIALGRAADDESRIYGWGMHAVMAGVNIGAGLAEGLLYDDIWTLAVVGMVTGIAVGELEIWTQPTDAVEVRRHYLRGELAPPPEARARLRLAVVPWHAGLALAGVF